MKISLGTQSNLKKEAVQETIDKYSTDLDLDKVTIELNNVTSNVPETPYNEQAFEGAKNRATALFKDKHERNTLYVGIESSIAERAGLLFEECWCVIYSEQKKYHVGYSSGFMLPSDISIRMKNGESHIDVMTEKGKELNLSTKDTWTIYSSGLIQRKESLKEAFRNALFSYHTSILA